MSSPDNVEVVEVYHSAENDCRAGSPGSERSIKADKPGANFREDAELIPTLPSLYSDLSLQNIAARLEASRTSAWEVVTLSVNRDVVSEVVSDATADSNLSFLGGPG